MPKIKTPDTSKSVDYGKAASIKKPKNTEIPLYYVDGILTDKLPASTQAAEHPPVKVHQIEASVDQWTRSKLKEHQKKFSSDHKAEVSHLWGDNFSLHIRNLGRVIGKQYTLDGAGPSARYRIDYDFEKGAHFNIEMLPPLAGKFVVIFKDQKHINLIDLPLNLRLKQLYDGVKPKHNDELRIIQYSRQMTNQALNDAKSMPEDIAEDILRHAEMSHVRNDVRVYFEELGSLMPALLNSARHVLELKNTRLIEEEKLAREAAMKREEEEARKEKLLQMEQAKREAQRKHEFELQKQVDIEIRRLDALRKIEREKPVVQPQKESCCEIVMNKLYGLFFVKSKADGVPVVNYRKKFKY